MLTVTVTVLWAVSAAVHIFLDYRIARFRRDHPKWEDDRFFGNPQRDLDTYDRAFYTEPGQKLFPVFIASFVLFSAMTVILIVTLALWR